MRQFIADLAVRTQELAETAAERDGYKRQLADLKQTAAACPAYGTVGKRGNFEP